MHPTEKPIWFAALVNEARRDLVFAWHIAQGSFGGLKEQAAVPSELFMEAAQHLLVAGSKVGFGDPDADDWRDLPDMKESNDENARFIAGLWKSNRPEYEFLVFAIRS